MNNSFESFGDDNILSASLHLISHKTQTFYKKRNGNSSDVELQLERDTLTFFKMEREMKEEEGLLKVICYICLSVIFIFSLMTSVACAEECSNFFQVHVVDSQDDGTTVIALDFPGSVQLVNQKTLSEGDVWTLTVGDWNSSCDIRLATWTTETDVMVWTPNFGDSEDMDPDYGPGDVVDIYADGELVEGGHHLRTYPGKMFFTWFVEGGVDPNKILIIKLDKTLDLLLALELEGTKTHQLTATGVAINGSERDVTGNMIWGASSNPNVLTVHPNGLATLLNYGTAYVNVFPDESISSGLPQSYSMRINVYMDPRERGFRNCVQSGDIQCRCQFPGPGAPNVCLYIVPVICSGNNCTPRYVQGNAFDYEDRMECGINTWNSDGALCGDAIVWNSSRDGQIGTGRLLNFDEIRLSPGVHIITVTATDSDGNTDSEQFTWIKESAMPWIPLLLDD